MIYCGRPAGAGIQEGNSSSAWATYGYIQGNSFSWMGANTSARNSPSPSAQGAEAAYIVGDHHLIENNDLSHVIDGFTVYGQFNILRNNKMHDTNNADWTNKAQEDHIDFLESFCGSSIAENAFHTLVEENSDIRNYNSSATNAHLFGVAQYCYQSGQGHAIVRYNVFAHSATAAGGGYGALVGVPGDSTAGYLNFKLYNNTTAAAGASGDVLDFFGPGSTGGAVINAIYYFPGSVTTAPYSPQGVSIASNHNLGFCATGSCSLAQFGDIGNITGKDPKFVSYAGDDYHLQSGSPGIGAGSNLTTVASADGGSGTTLVVNDAWFFQDGWGVTGVQADWIRVGPSTTVQISSIDYTTNTITLSSAISRSNGAQVYLYKDSGGNVVLTGSFPDLGAFPYRGGSTPPSAPLNLQIR
jgi:hypothetical protein